MLQFDSEILHSSNDMTLLSFVNLFLLHFVLLIDHLHDPKKG